MKAFHRRKYTSYEDEELMKLVGRGETRAFDELYGRYGKRLLYYFYRMLGSDQEKAQDFLHDLFLKIVERPELFSVDRKFSTWVFSVAHNMCKNEYRSRAVRNPVSLDFDTVPFEMEDISATLDRNEFFRMLERELEQIDEEHRTAFLLRHREGFSIREIGEILACPEGTVKSRLFYTARRLAERLRTFNPQEY